MKVIRTREERDLTEIERVRQPFYSIGGVPISLRARYINV